MERGISIMDNEGLPYGFSGEVLQSFPTFFTFQDAHNLVNDFNIDIFIDGNAEPSVARHGKFIVSPTEFFPGSTQPGNGGPKGLICDAFGVGDGLERENSDLHSNNNVSTDDINCNIIVVDSVHNIFVALYTILLFNSLVSRKGEAPGTVTPKASLLTLKVEVEVGAKSMLHPSKGSYQHANIFLTPSVAGVQKIQSSTQSLPGDSSLFEACDYCDSRAVEEVTSFHGDEEHIQFLCEKCWLMGFAPEVEEVAA